MEPMPGIGATCATGSPLATRAVRLMLDVRRSGRAGSRPSGVRRDLLRRLPWPAGEDRAVFVAVPGHDEVQQLGPVGAELGCYVAESVPAVVRHGNGVLPVLPVRLGH